MHIVRRCRDTDDCLQYLTAMERAGAMVVGIVPSDGKFSPPESTLMIFARVKDIDHMFEVDARYGSCLP